MQIHYLSADTVQQLECGQFLQGPRPQQPFLWQAPSTEMGPALTFLVLLTAQCESRLEENVMSQTKPTAWGSPTCVPHVGSRDPLIQVICGFRRLVSRKPGRK